MLEVGLRVVRGQDWKWGDQDGGEGHAGTVVEIGKSTACPQSADRTPDKTVIVQWDHGSRSNYRIGYQGAYDVLLFDNASTGVKHSNIVCDGCKRYGIAGIRWKCAQCFDFDLCTQCYMSDKHDLNHTFQRFLTAKTIGVPVGPRKGCTKIPLRGIFIGAKVIRGPDWEWGNQDGGRGKTGRVMDIRGWDNESSRSVATVTWTTGSTNVYRLGYKGCVDLCYVEEATAGTYYKEHLPLLGQTAMAIPDNENNTSLEGEAQRRVVSSPSHLTFNVGDKVKVLIDVDTLKEMQTGHGGWNPRMAEDIGKIGVVHRVTDKGDIRVQYENNRWTFNPEALTKVITKDSFNLGNIVRVKSDIATVKHYQKGHGEWIDMMKLALGKTGKVIKIYPDGDLRVDINGHTWTFNPMNVTLVPGGTSTANASTPDRYERVDVEIEKLLRDAARGEAGVQSVREFLRKYPNRVDARAGGPGGGKKTCLQVAAHQGQRELCLLLLDSGASLSAVDEDGDTPLHYAAFGNQPGIMELLLSRGASIDALNNGKCSALHVAVNKQHKYCVSTLLNHNCNVNLQDSYGDTALHDAIGKEDLDIIDALCTQESVDFTLLNKRGFNVLHHAALKGNAHATQQLAMRAQHLVDVKKEDGFAALHLAALNGHRGVAEILLSPIGRAQVDLHNNRRQTPLHLATSQGHWSIVELLINHSADIAATDEDGDTALHIAIAKSQHQSSTVAVPENSTESPLIYNIWQNLARQGAKTELALACFLVSMDRSRAILEQARNAKNETPLDLVQEDPQATTLTDLLKTYLHLRPEQTSVIETSAPSNDLQPVVSSSQVDTTIGDQGRPSRGSSNSNNLCRGCSAVISPEEETILKKRTSGVVNSSHCIRCGQVIISNRSNQGGSSTHEITVSEKEKRSIEDKRAEEKNRDKEKEKDLERLRYLETRVADLEEANMCSICMERRRNVAFLCGHGACEHCATPLKTCHMCRKTIDKKINLY